MLHEDLPPLPVACVTTPSEDSAFQLNIATEIAPHVTNVDYPEVKRALLSILSCFRKAIPLPSEPLGVTHQIALQTGAQSSYVPPYRLSHSQSAFVQNVIEDLLGEGVIQESYSPSNHHFF